jgi:hypothetical protein
MSESGGEKREGRRFAILGDLHGEVMIFQPISITEISHTGAKIDSAFPLHLESLHEFKLTLGSRSVVLKGRITHCAISDVDQESVVYRSGVEFTEPSERVREVIDEFIEALKSGRGEA